MATSAVMDHQTTTAGVQDHDQHPIRRSSGRRKAKGGYDSKKNKQPRRGMGVAKLEQRLREENEITVADQPGFPLPSFSEMNFYHLHQTRNPVGFPGFYGLMGMDTHHQFGNDSDFLVKSSDENVVKCYSLHCNACHKKKKINVAARPEMYKCGSRRFLGLDFGDNQNIINQDIGNYGNKVEVVAVHRKGSSSSWDGGNHRVLMEYDFFPSHTNIDPNHGELAMVKQPVGNSAMAGFDASICVDLSLKLSY